MNVELDDRYTTGEYLSSTGGTWHLEDSPYKADQIMRILQRHPLDLRTVCEIGCGAGGILAELSKRLGDSVQFVGYDISPQAHKISQQFRRPNINFVLGDAFADQEVFDLVLIMDVVEHVEDCFGFLRNVKQKGTYKIYHLPLEISCSSALRDSFMNSWRQVGHIHRFSESTALEILRSTGHEIVDYVFTPGALSLAKTSRTKFANLFRRMFPPRLATRLFGGYSILILAK
ncbi:MAG: class I SAM-dependent methyltransferase [Planctomycetota bacterium]